MTDKMSGREKDQVYGIAGNTAKRRLKRWKEEEKGKGVGEGGRRAE